MGADFESESSSRRDSAAARAYEFVKQRLLDGRYLGGMLLSENQIARQLGISRTPVRQAFQQLEVEDLLELYPRRGALVRPIAPSEAEDVLEARLLIERHCARRDAAQGAALAPSLYESIARQESALATGGADFIAADREFHRRIVAANGNPILTRQYDALRDRLQRIVASAVARDPNRMATFIAEHRDIADAIAAGDARAAGEKVSVHLRRAHALARRSRV
jgi:DNA-binding GntR family transcriptional regulator